GVKGVVVRLWVDTNHDGRADHVVAVTTTDAVGHYAFPNQRPGLYQVQFVQPAGTLFTRSNHGTPATDSDAHANGFTRSFVLAAGQTDKTRDAGIVRLASLCGSVFSDDNDNGRRDPTERGLAGVVISLTGTDL